MPIKADGSAGTPRIAIANVQNVPDGLAIAPDGTIYVSCYEPSRIYRQKPGGALEILIEDPAATTIAHPTNIALKGNTLYTRQSRTLAHHRDRSLRIVESPGATHGMAVVAKHRLRIFNRPREASAQASRP